MKRKTGAFLCLFISILLCFNTEVFAAVFTFETQYDYASADKAWLTDLVIKEDMLTVGGLSQRTELTALPDSPYSETPASFKKEADEYSSLYSLNENSGRAGYIYLFELLGSDESIFSLGATDADVKDYLQGNGVSYPSSTDSDDRIMARALYVAMMTGTFTLSDYYNSSADVALEQALVTYVSKLSGIDNSSLTEWLPSENILSLDEYILAASRLSLWTNGYDVTVNTDSSEVYRLMAVMTVEKLGISVNRNLPFSELKVIYTAALLGEKYGVTMDSDKLSSALADDTVAFYILQLMGQKNGLSIRSENSTYEEAFYTVAENSDVFDIETDEFYADIYKYEGQLTNKCSSVWVYPTAYATGDSGAEITVTANGQTIRNNFFTEVKLNPSLKSEDLIIKVSVVCGTATYTCTYTVTLKQGTETADDTSETEKTDENSTYATSDSIVSGIFSKLGINDSVSSILDDFYTALPTTVKNTISLIAPTFDEDTSSENESTSAESGGIFSDEYYLQILDKIGAFADSDITGIGGVEMFENYSSDVFSFDYITFD